MVCPGRPGRARYCFVQRLFAQSSDIAARCPSPGVGYPLGGILVQTVEYADSHSR